MVSLSSPAQIVPTAPSCAAERAGYGGPRPGRLRGRPRPPSSRLPRPPSPSPPPDAPRPRSRIQARPSRVRGVSESVVSCQYPSPSESYRADASRDPSPTSSPDLPRPRIRPGRSRPSPIRRSPSGPDDRDAGPGRRAPGRHPRPVSGTHGRVVWLVGTTRAGGPPGRWEGGKGVRRCACSALGAGPAPPMSADTTCIYSSLASSLARGWQPAAPARIRTTRARRLGFGRLGFGRLGFGRLGFGRLVFGRLVFGRLGSGRRGSGRLGVTITAAPTRPPAPAPIRAIPAPTHVRMFDGDSAPYMHT